jgi:hypothetical protein
MSFFPSGTTVSTILGSAEIFLGDTLNVSGGHTLVPGGILLHVVRIAAK